MSDSAPARFVVGTGRCGSTLLSRMLSENAELLSLFEWFSGIDLFFRFRADPVDGAELAGRLAQDHPMLTMVLKRGYRVPEVVYPFDRPDTRFALGDPIPWCLAIALPRISDEPDALFDAMIARVEQLPRQPLARHYRTIFEWLAERHGRRCWIEKSGGSIEFLGDLHTLFPEARFVHIHRDGREAALSMREYAAMRAAVVVLNGLVGEIEYSYEGLTELERTDSASIDRLLATRPPIELYGRYWAQQIERGHAARAALGADAYLEVRFEDLVADPRGSLRRIRDFLDLSGGEGWVERAAALVGAMPPLRYLELSPEEQKRLDEACAPAMALLGREA